MIGHSRGKTTSMIHVAWMLAATAVAGAGGSLAAPQAATVKGTCAYVASRLAQTVAKIEHVLQELRGRDLDSDALDNAQRYLETHYYRGPIAKTGEPIIVVSKGQPPMTIGTLIALGPTLDGAKGQAPRPTLVLRQASGATTELTIDAYLERGYGLAWKGAGGTLERHDSALAELRRIREAVVAGKVTWPATADPFKRYFELTGEYPRLDDPRRITALTFKDGKPRFRTALVEGVGGRTKEVPATEASLDYAERRHQALKEIAAHERPVAERVSETFAPIFQNILHAGKNAAEVSHWYRDLVDFERTDIAVRREAHENLARVLDSSQMLGAQHELLVLYGDQAVGRLKSISPPEAGKPAQVKSMDGITYPAHLVTVSEHRKSGPWTPTMQVSKVRSVEELLELAAGWANLSPPDKLALRTEFAHAMATRASKGDAGYVGQVTAPLLVTGMSDEGKLISKYGTSPIGELRFFAADRMPVGEVFSSSLSQRMEAIAREINDQIREAAGKPLNDSALTRIRMLLTKLDAHLSLHDRSLQMVDPQTSRGDGKRMASIGDAAIRKLVDGKVILTTSLAHADALTGLLSRRKTAAHGQPVRIPDHLKPFDANIVSVSTQAVPELGLGSDTIAITFNGRSGGRSAWVMANPEAASPAWASASTDASGLESTLSVASRLRQAVAKGSNDKLSALMKKLLVNVPMADLKVRDRLGRRVLEGFDAEGVSLGLLDTFVEGDAPELDFVSETGRRRVERSKVAHLRLRASPFVDETQMRVDAYQRAPLSMTTDEASTKALLASVAPGHRLYVRDRTSGVVVGEFSSFSYGTVRLRRSRQYYSIEDVEITHARSDLEVSDHSLAVLQRKVFDATLDAQDPVRARESIELASDALQTINVSLKATLPKAKAGDNPYSELVARDSGGIAIGTVVGIEPDGMFVIAANKDQKLKLHPGDFYLSRTLTKAEEASPWSPQHLEYAHVRDVGALEREIRGSMGKSDEDHVVSASQVRAALEIQARALDWKSGRPVGVWRFGQNEQGVLSATTRIGYLAEYDPLKNAYLVDGRWYPAEQVVLREIPGKVVPDASTRPGTEAGSEFAGTVLTVFGNSSGKFMQTHGTTAGTVTAPLELSETGQTVATDWINRARENYFSAARSRGAPSERLEQASQEALQDQEHFWFTSVNVTGDPSRGPDAILGVIDGSSYVSEYGEPVPPTPLLLTKALKTRHGSLPGYKPAELGQDGSSQPLVLQATFGMKTGGDGATHKSFFEPAIDRAWYELATRTEETKVSLGRPSVIYSHSFDLDSTTHLARHFTFEPVAFRNQETGRWISLKAGDIEATKSYLQRVKEDPSVKPPAIFARQQINQLEFVLRTTGDALVEKFGSGYAERAKLASKQSGRKRSDLDASGELERLAAIIDLPQLGPYQGNKATERQQLDFSPGFGPAAGRYQPRLAMSQARSPARSVASARTVKVSAAEDSTGANGTIRDIGGLLERLTSGKRTYQKSENLRVADSLRKLVAKHYEKHDAEPIWVYNRVGDAFGQLLPERDLDGFRIKRPNLTWDLVTFEQYVSEGYSLGTARRILTGPKAGELAQAEVHPARSSGYSAKRLYKQLLQAHGAISGKIPLSSVLASELQAAPAFIYEADGVTRRGRIMDYRQGYLEILKDTGEVENLLAWDLVTHRLHLGDAFEAGAGPRMLLSQIEDGLGRASPDDKAAAISALKLYQEIFGENPLVKPSSADRRSGPRYLSHIKKEVHVLWPLSAFLTTEPEPGGRDFYKAKADASIQLILPPKIGGDAMRPATWGFDASQVVPLAWARGRQTYFKRETGGRWLRLMPKDKVPLGAEVREAASLAELDRMFATEIATAAKDPGNPQILDNFFTVSATNLNLDGTRPTGPITANNRGHRSAKSFFDAIQALAHSYLGTDSSGNEIVFHYDSYVDAAAGGKDPIYVYGADGRTSIGVLDGITRNGAILVRQEGFISSYSPFEFLSSRWGLGDRKQVRSGAAFELSQINLVLQGDKTLYYDPLLAYQRLTGEHAPLLDAVQGMTFLSAIDLQKGRLSFADGASVKNESMMSLDRLGRTRVREAHDNLAVTKATDFEKEIRLLRKKGTPAQRKDLLRRLATKSKKAGRPLLARLSGSPEWIDVSGATAAANKHRYDWQKIEELSVIAGASGLPEAAGSARQVKLVSKDTDRITGLTSLELADAQGRAYDVRFQDDYALVLTQKTSLGQTELYKVLDRVQLANNKERQAIGRMVQSARGQASVREKSIFAVAKDGAFAMPWSNKTVITLNGQIANLHATPDRLVDPSTIRLVEARDLQEVNQMRMVEFQNWLVHLFEAAPGKPIGARAIGELATQANVRLSKLALDGLQVQVMGYTGQAIGRLKTIDRLTGRMLVETPLKTTVSLRAHEGYLVPAGAHEISAFFEPTDPAYPTVRPIEILGSKVSNWAHLSPEVQARVALELNAHSLNWARNTPVRAYDIKTGNSLGYLTGFDAHTGRVLIGGIPTRLDGISLRHVAVTGEPNQHSGEYWADKPMPGSDDFDELPGEVLSVKGLTDSVDGKRKALATTYRKGAVLRALVDMATGEHRQLIKWMSNNIEELFNFYRANGMKEETLKDAREAQHSVIWNRFWMVATKKVNTKLVAESTLASFDGSTIGEQTVPLPLEVGVRAYKVPERTNPEVGLEEFGRAKTGSGDGDVIGALTKPFEMERNTAEYASSIDEKYVSVGRDVAIYAHCVKLATAKVFHTRHTLKITAIEDGDGYRDLTANERAELEKYIEQGAPTKMVDGRMTCTDCPKFLKDRPDLDQTEFILRTTGTELVKKFGRAYTARVELAEKRQSIRSQEIVASELFMEDDQIAAKRVSNLIESMDQNNDVPDYGIGTIDPTRGISSNASMQPGLFTPRHDMSEAERRAAESEARMLRLLGEQNRAAEKKPGGKPGQLNWTRHFY